jgi:hypothetical protein
MLYPPGWHGQPEKILLACCASVFNRVICQVAVESLRILSMSDERSLQTRQA